MRLLLVLGCILLIVLLLLGMRWGWRNRLERQSDLPDLPAVPTALGPALLAPIEGVYVGSAFASSWQDRVAVRGLGMRAPATATLHDAGVLIERRGAADLFVPAESIVDARLAPGLAGKVVGAGGLLVIRWRVGGEATANGWSGGYELDSGLRADDKSAYPAWVRTINAKAVA